MSAALKPLKQAKPFEVTVFFHLLGVVFSDRIAGVSSKKMLCAGTPAIKKTAFSV